LEHELVAMGDWAGINPLVSHFVCYPSGFHMAWADAVPGAALLASPITILGNAAVSYNIAMLLAPPSAAWCAFLLVRNITHNSSAAIVAGYFFGFSSYQLSQMLGHLSLVLIFPVPLVLLITLKRIARETSRSRFVLTLTGCLLLEFGFSLEICATVCTFGALTWLVAIALSPPDTRRRLYSLVPEFLLSGAVLTVPIPAGRDVQVRSTPTFVPNTMLHNGDTRELSLSIKRVDYQ
jgi:hypothetical protein